MKVAKPAVLAFLCALALVVTSDFTAEAIEENQRLFAERQLRDMVPGAELIRRDGYHEVRFADGGLGKIVTASTGRGYNGPIELLVAITSSGEIINVRVTRHRETPGLGDRIEVEVSDWILGFNGRSLANSTFILKPGGDIDGLSGATITARAVTSAVAEVLGDD